MKIKFSKFERIAGIFVLVAIVGAISMTMTAAVRKGWFSSKVGFETTLQNADGIHAGTAIQIAGLQAGGVEEVELISANEVRVRFEIFKKFHKRVRTDSEVLVVRPFIIGDKVLDVSVGSEKAAILPANSKIVSSPSFDLMDLASGRKLGPLLSNLGQLVENFKILAEAFSDKNRTEAIVRMFDTMEPMIGNLNQMSRGVIVLTNALNREKRMEVISENLAIMSKELGVVLPEMRKEVPELGQQMGMLVVNLGELSKQFAKLGPAIDKVAPQLPRAGVRAVEALDEAVVLLKAMQKTFLLSGKVEEVRDAENKRRSPASE